MGLENGYKSFKDIYQDNGEEITVIIPDTPYNPDFRARNTIQTWNVTNSPDQLSVEEWVGNTLVDRSLHELTIVNNSGINKRITFDAHYFFNDEDGCATGSIIEIGAGGTAYFIGTGNYREGNLVLVLSTGTQDDRKI